MNESVLVRWMNLEPAIQSEVSQKEKNKYRILTHIYGIQENGSSKYLQGRNREADIKNTCMDPAREGEGGTSNIETHTLPLVKQLAGNCVQTKSSTQGSVTISRSGMGWRVGGRFNRRFNHSYNRDPLYLYLWLIHVVV